MEQEDKEQEREQEQEQEPQEQEQDPDQQYCLRWNNFQANITSQFEALRDDEDFTDVTIACDGQRVQAHKVVLSACSPFFKELFKTNPCRHPIIFMRDVDSKSVVALMEFMYKGQVNVAQNNLTAFLKLAESLKIRGLTDSNTDFGNKDITKEFLSASATSASQDAKITGMEVTRLSHSVQNMKGDHHHHRSEGAMQSFPHQSSNQTQTSHNTKASSAEECESSAKRLKQDAHHGHGHSHDASMPSSKSTTPADSNNIIIDDMEHHDNMLQMRDTNTGQQGHGHGHGAHGGHGHGQGRQPKVEMPEYMSDDDRGGLVNIGDAKSYLNDAVALDMTGMDILPLQSALSSTLEAAEHNFGAVRHNANRTHSLEPRTCEECGRTYSNLSNLRQHMKLVHFPTNTSCPICTKSFKSDLYLRRHMHHTHDSPGKVENNAFLCPPKPKQYQPLATNPNQPHQPIPHSLLPHPNPANLPPKYYTDMSCTHNPNAMHAHSKNKLLRTNIPNYKL